MGHRVRDIVMGHDGRIVVWTDEGDVLLHRTGKGPGRRSPDYTVHGLHGLNLWDPAFLAPNLSMIVVPARCLKTGL